MLAGKESESHGEGQNFIPKGPILSLEQVTSVVAGRCGRKPKSRRGTQQVSGGRGSGWAGTSPKENPAASRGCNSGCDRALLMPALQEGKEVAEV